MFVNGNQEAANATFLFLLVWIYLCISLAASELAALDFYISKSVNNIEVFIHRIAMVYLSAAIN